MTELKTLPEISLEHVRLLEQLHLVFLNARLRKRKTITLKDFERFEPALKAVLPPFDFFSKGRNNEI